MSLPKKTDIKIYKDEELLGQRERLLKRITKSDTNLPDGILHDDLDMGMLEFVKENFKVISDGEQIPITPKILTVQRWSEINNTWTFADDDRNIKIPFIAVIRKPDPQPGTNPVIQRNIPDRRQIFYSTVKTWDGNQFGADVYKIPQPVAIDIGFEVVIVCNKFRDLNRFNKIILQKFSSRQAYTTVKGHYIPIVMDSINDNSPIDNVESRRFYQQTYNFTMLGFLIDPDEFEVKPAINRMLILNEFMSTKNYNKKYIYKSIDITTANFVADGDQSIFSVGESIGFLFFVAINGQVQQRDIDYYWISLTPRISFISPPPPGSNVMILYYAGRSNVFQDSFGRILFYTTQNFVYDGSSQSFSLDNEAADIIYVEINGLVEEIGVGYTFENNQITLTHPPVVGSRVGVAYLR